MKPVVVYLPEMFAFFNEQERQSSREGSSAPCAFRISSEGLPVILPYITKQILHASPVDFKHLLQYKSIKFADFVDAEFGEKATNLMMGCCVIVLRKGLWRYDISLFFQRWLSLSAMHVYIKLISFFAVLQVTKFQQMLPYLMHQQSPSAAGRGGPA